MSSDPRSLPNKHGKRHGDAVCLSIELYINSWFFKPVPRRRRNSRLNSDSAGIPTGSDQKAWKNPRTLLARLGEGGGIEPNVDSVALTDDPKLETVLPKILPYSISSLSSCSPAIRKKVMEILTHLNKRVKHQKSIRLPVMELWKEYMEVGAALIVRNFCMIYIEMTFDRLTAEEKADMAPMLIANISHVIFVHASP